MKEPLRQLSTVLNTLKFVSALSVRRYKQLELERQKMTRIWSICNSTVLNDAQKVSGVRAIACLELSERLAPRKALT